MGGQGEQKHVVNGLLKCIYKRQADNLFILLVGGVENLV